MHGQCLPASADTPIYSSGIVVVGRIVVYRSSVLVGRMGMVTVEKESSRRYIEWVGRAEGGRKGGRNGADDG